MKASIRWRWCGLMLLAVGLAACASGPKPPLMSPIAVGKNYGYSEVQTGDNQYEVTYTVPVRQSTRAVSQRQADATAARTQGYDFALWRAAQLAIERGFAGFRVINSHANIDTVLDEPYSDPFYADPFYGPPYWGPYGFRSYRPYPFGYPPSYFGPSPYAYLQAQVTVNVQLLQNPGPGDYDAQDVIRQLQRTYPTAEREIAERTSVRALAS
jgi:hypothetical protein